MISDLRKDEKSYSWGPQFKYSILFAPWGLWGHRGGF